MIVNMKQFVSALLICTVMLTIIQACKKSGQTEQKKIYTAITVTSTSAIIGVGNNVVIAATILGDAGLDLTPSYTSANSAIATVNSTTGTIYGIADGETTVTAATKDGSKKAVIQVKVVSADKAVVPRPAHNNGTGFFTNNGKIYDANGKQFIPMGFNGAVFWQDESCAKKSIAEIAKTNANAVRLVSVIPAKSSWSWSSRFINQRALIDSCIKYQLVPVLEFHDATCGVGYETDADNKDLKSVVDYWLTPELVQLCKDYEQKMIVNIANEWGPGDINWKIAYDTAVAKMRRAGINNLMMIDAGGNCGQNPNTILTWAQNIIDADPQKNIVFSQHMYAFWVTADKTKEGWQHSVETTLTQFKDLNIPFVVGEFGWEGTTDVRYNPRLIVQKCAELGAGWFFWSWFDQPTVPYYSAIKNHCTGFQSNENLTAAGEWIVNSPSFGLKARAFRCSIY
jgi:hypothetical protein